METRSELVHSQLTITTVFSQLYIYYTGNCKYDEIWWYSQGLQVRTDKVVVKQIKSLVKFQETEINLFNYVKQNGDVFHGHEKVHEACLSSQDTVPDVLGKSVPMKLRSN